MQFRGASADALTAVSDELGTRLQGGSDAARVGSDLFTVASLLRSEPGFRRVATDLSVEPAAKQQLVTDLFGARVEAASLEVVKVAVSRRWTSSRDLADALERLSEVAVVRSAGTDAARLSDELFSFNQVVAANPALRDALSDRARSTADKAALVRSLLEGKALGATITLATQAVAGTYRTVGVALTEYQKVAAQVAGQSVATVRVAHPLAATDRQRLADALSRQYSRPIHLNVLVDPSVVGGMSVEIDNDVIDGTVAGRLDDVRRKLAG
jgi:F-type H+-transporting ATPase subunit delta